MIHKKLLILVCVLAAVTVVYNKPTYKSGIRHCFKRECPENTYACEKLSRISDDKKSIIAEIHCLDLRGNNLKNITTFEENPFSSDTEYRGYSYAGAFEVSQTGENRINSGGSHNENHESHKNSGSEVEDLNNR